MKKFVGFYFTLVVMVLYCLYASYFSNYILKEDSVPEQVVKLMMKLH